MPMSFVITILQVRYFIIFIFEFLFSKDEAISLTAYFPYIMIMWNVPEAAKTARLKVVES
jgi:hypothetical protein